MNDDIELPTANESIRQTKLYIERKNREGKADLLMHITDVSHAGGYYIEVNDVFEAYRYQAKYIKTHREELAKLGYLVVTKYTACLDLTNYYVHWGMTKNAPWIRQRQWKKFQRTEGTGEKINDGDN